MDNEMEVMVDDKKEMIVDDTHKITVSDAKELILDDGGKCTVGDEQGNTVDDRKEMVIDGGKNLRKRIKHCQYSDVHSDFNSDSDFDDDLDKDYVPASSEADDESDSSDKSEEYPMLKMCRMSELTVDDGKEITEDEKGGKKGVKVKSSTNNKHQRLWDRRNACYYCSSLETNIGRHLLRIHKEETLVKKTCTFSKNSKERKHELEKLRHLGNFYHNAKVLVSGEGELLVAKRPPNGTNVEFEDYTPCVFCKGYFVAVDIWKHYKVCKFNADSIHDCNEESQKPQQKGTLKESRMMMAALKEAHPNDYIHGQLFGTMKMDSVKMICEKDEIISKFGRNILSCKGTDHTTYVRAKMREMGRLLEKVREKVQSVDDNAQEMTVKGMLHPSRYDIIVEGIHSLCTYKLQKEKKNVPQFDIPSLALKLGHSLRKCAAIKRGICIRAEDLNGEKEANAFMQLMDTEFNQKVSSIALTTLKDNKKPTALPVTSDVVKFSTFIRNKVLSLCTELKLEHAGEKSTSAIYQYLAKATLSRIITFNRKRSGECGRMLVDDYINKLEVREGGSKDVFHMLSPAEQKLSHRLDMMTIKGKRGRQVPVILTEDIGKALTLLVDANIRTKAGIVSENRYAFPMSRGSLFNIRGCDALADIVREANLTNPRAFHSTNLRKYVATVSQVLNMQENEVEWLARHLGHDIKVHREYYRLQEQHVELAKVSKLLFAVDNGKAHLYSGKTLNEVQIEGFEDEELGTDSEDNSDFPDEEPGDSDEKDMTVGDNDEKEVTVGDNVEKEMTVDETEGLGAVGGAPDQRKMPRIKGKRCPHTAWSASEKRYVMDVFHKFIIKGSLNGVGKKECEDAKAKAGPLLASRTWIQIKSCVKNIIDKNKREELKRNRRKDSR